MDIKLFYNNNILAYEREINAELHIHWRPSAKTCIQGNTIINFDPGYFRKSNPISGTDTTERLQSLLFIDAAMIKCLFVADKVGKAMN